MNLQTNRYYEAFLYYHDLAKKQQAMCNLGSQPYEGSVPDDLMCKVELYDVVERKYAGFSQLPNDLIYGWTSYHPYWPKMQVGNCTMQRQTIATDFTSKQWDLDAWLYMLLFHRITGSGINYAKKPSGYNNTLLPYFVDCKDISEMIEVMRAYPKPFYTSVGYQFPQFPKPIEGYKRGGDYYLAEYAPKLINELIAFLYTPGPGGVLQKNLRTIGDWMLKWNRDHGLKQYNFQYAAFVADLADWFPQYVYRESMFYYGSNSKACSRFMMEDSPSLKNMDLLMQKAMEDTGGLPYNLEDVHCDAIRWIENYIRPGGDYEHLDRDKVWSSSPIIDHPYGRQKAMLDLGLVKSFNDLPYHPTGDRVIREAGLTPEEYRKKVRDLYGLPKQS